MVQFLSSFDCQRIIENTAINSRINIVKLLGIYVKRFFVSKTLGEGSMWQLLTFLHKTSMFSSHHCSFLTKSS